MRRPVRPTLQVAGDRSSGPVAEETTVQEIEETVIPPPSPVCGEFALRSLARWLVSAARKGAPVAELGPIESSQNCLDVPRDTEVASKPEAGELAVQQAIQRNTR
jgi:hypothetical protein